MKTKFRLPVKARYFLLTLLAVVFIESCGYTSVESQLSNMKKPVILKAESDNSGILLIDAKGNVVIYSNDYVITGIIRDTYNIGDTVFFNNIKK